MSILGIIFMWVWMMIAFYIVNQWMTGKESDRRKAYWERYEKK